VRFALAVCVTVLASAAAVATPAGATNECHGITKCIHIQGPWVYVPAHGTTQYLVSCPGGRGVVGGLDAQATSADVRVEFVGRLGAPVQPGTTTTTAALFRAVSVSAKPQAFRPLLGCIPQQGGGGRSTVSARVVEPGPSPIYRARIAVVGPGQVRVARVTCRAVEKLVGSWTALAFRVKKPPRLQNGTLVQISKVVLLKHKQVVATAAATDGLSSGAHAVVQAGVGCAP
jgi:hypothetical protein